ncbi:hypothetical protein ACIBI9_65465 [Nonomuraea sp. NPDC050451]|uniref:hypothetical protein n=1 Tax=Nonomuraea sp. NPDC050451 TaxID=3364364 RepID=UPI0037B5DF6B
MNWEQLPANLPVPLDDGGADHLPTTDRRTVLNARGLRVPRPSRGADRRRHGGCTDFLPSYATGGLRLYRRLTLVIRGGRIEHVFHPIFPPDPHAQQVLDWLHTHPTTTPSTRRGDG